MALRIPVYASHVTSLSDARFFAAMGVRYIGICADMNSSHYFSPEQFREVAGWVFGPEFVIEADHLPVPDLPGLAAAYGVNLFRLRPDQVNVGLTDALRFGLITDHPHHYEAVFTISSLAGIHSSVSTFATGIDTVEQVRAMLRNHPDSGLVVLGTPEQAAGIKDYDARELLEFLDTE